MISSMTKTAPDLLEDVEAFLKRHDMKPTTLGRLAKGDPNFVFDLRAGREGRSSTEATVRDFMNERDEQLQSRKRRARAA